MSDEVVSGGGEVTESAAPETDDSDILETETESEPEETVDEAEDDSESDPAPKPSSPPKPKTPAKEKDDPAEEKPKDPPKPKGKVVRGKVNGEELDIELTPEESQALAAKQMRIAGQRALQEAAELRKQAESVLSKLKDDPLSALKAAGIDVDRVVEKYALDYVKQQQMTPEQKRAYDLEQELQRVKGEQEARQKEEETLILAEERKRLTQTLDKEFAEGAKAANLPPSPRNIARMAQIVQAYNEQGYDLDPAEAAEMVGEELRQEHAHLFGGLDGEDLLNALGKDVVEKVRKTLVAKVKAQRVNPRVVEPVAPAKRPEKKVYGSMSEFMRSLPAEYRR